MGDAASSPVLTCNAPSREELDKGLECTMCLNFLCIPTTLLCGHSFCQECLLSWLRTGQRVCPLCRSTATRPKSGGLRPSFALELACRFLYGAEYDRRIKEFEETKLIPPKASRSTPFVNTRALSFPPQSCCNPRTSRPTSRVPGRGTSSAPARCRPGPSSGRLGAGALPHALWRQRQRRRRQRGRRAEARPRPRGRAPRRPPAALPPTAAGGDAGRLRQRAGGEGGAGGAGEGAKSYIRIFRCVFIRENGRTSSRLYCGRGRVIARLARVRVRLSAYSQERVLARTLSCAHPRACAVIVRILAVVVACDRGCVWARGAYALEPVCGRACSCACGVRAVVCVRVGGGVGEEEGEGEGEGKGEG
jgi:hypothetical protein